MIAVVALMIVPLPGVVLDLLLSINIAFGVLLLLATIMSARALDLAAFPSLLLIATLFRLALNVSSTRLILTTGSAGGVIASFGSFVVGGSVVVGLVVFLILVVIQFVVVTNGASRVAEVGARFTLDALPGKQMAIDADLGAGLIDEEEARQRRREVSAEADFYGAMDGASKFVKGDAVAGVLITMINLIGGLVIGVAQNGMALSDAINTFSTLTIGDGLVSQIPALLISIASGIIVTRANGDSNLGSDVVSQITAQHQALRYGGITVLLLGLAPGLPLLPFGVVGLSLLLLGRRFASKAASATDDVSEEVEDDSPPEPAQLAIEIRPEPLELELAIDMIDLVDSPSGGDLLDRVRALRRKIAMEIGLIIPPVRTRDNVNLGPGEYAITVHGVEMAQGTAPAGHVLVIAENLDPLPGPSTVEPVFGLPAKWLPIESKAMAEAVNATIVDRASVITTHLAETIRRQAAQLLSRQEVKELVDLVRQSDPAVVDELVASELTLAEVQRVLQDLLTEEVPIRDIVRILDVLGERARVTRDPIELTEAVRVALGPSISAGTADADGRVHTISIDPVLEQGLLSALQPGPQGFDFVLDPSLLHQVAMAIRKQVLMVEQRGHSPVIVSASALRRPLRKLMALTEVQAPVLSPEELGPQIHIETAGVVNLEEAEVESGERPAILGS
ncbi:MAG: FHIPEP family type III secretion protein [Actinomycetia bacterium]|nr:FHIPEP family type III secretion protein [Actinomycetes bacterium]MCP5035317.1 FHIPEP family type III secretion protein [Actinomycetes bacterium]